MEAADREERKDGRNKRSSVMRGGVAKNKSKK